MLIMDPRPAGREPSGSRRWTVCNRVKTNSWHETNGLLPLPRQWDGSSCRILNLAGLPAAVCSLWVAAARKKTQYAVSAWYRGMERLILTSRRVVSGAAGTTLASFVIRKVGRDREQRSL